MSFRTLQGVRFSGIEIFHAVYAINAYSDESELAIPIACTFKFFTRCC